MDDRAEFPHVISGHQAMGHELCIARYYLKRRFQLMGYVGGEIASQALGQGQLLVLRSQRALLRVDAGKQRLHFRVCGVL